MTAICQRAGKVRPQAHKASVQRPDTRIEAYYRAGANFVYIGSGRSDFEFDASAMRLAVAIIRANAERNTFIRVFAVICLHQGQIDSAKQMRADCRDMGHPTIARHLKKAGYTRGQVCNKIIGVLIISLARQMRDNQFHQLREPANCISDGRRKSADQIYFPFLWGSCSVSPRGKLPS
jgi:hypothetical protein